MKKLTLFLAGIMLMAFTANSQNQTIPVPSSPKQTVTATKGTTTQVEATTNIPRNCGTMENLEYLKQQDPTLEAKMNAEEQKFNDYIAAHQQELENNKTAYTLPVVVHVVYSSLTTAGGYVGLTQVQEQIAQTNSDWAGTNGRSMGAFPSTLRVDCGITLCLATKDPSGNATNGIDYKQTTVSSFSTNDYVKQTAHGGAAAWDPTKYMNIWVCNLGSSLCGYAQFPTSGINTTYGVVCHAKYFGHTGATAPYNLGGTISHEFGHCFNLYHTWGDDNGACTGTDNCNDTPASGGMNYGNIEDGSLSEQGCTSSINTTTKVETDPCVTSSPGVLYQDFMDYTDDKDYACMTLNQSTRMQTCVAQYLSSVASNSSTVCNLGPAAPVAAFTANVTTVTVGGSVTFTDQSSNTPTGWSWTFAGGAPATSTTQNPTVTYNTVGTYTVTLIASNTVGNNTCTKTGYITVIDGTVATCDTLHYVTGAGLSGTPVIYGSSAMGYLAGNNSYGDKIKADYFSSYSPYTEIEGAYFWFARATDAGSTTNITFNVYNNSGTDGNGAAGAPGAVIGTATVPLTTIKTNTAAGSMTGVAFASPVIITGPFYIGVVLPQSAGDTLALVTNTDGDTNPGTGWEQFADGTSWYPMSDATNSWGYNLQLGIFPVVCTSGTTGITESGTLESVLIYPNPANDVLNVNLVNYGKTDVTVNIYNTMGNLVKSMKADSKTLQIDLSDVVSGIYYVTLKSDKSSTTKKISIIK